MHQQLWVKFALPSLLSSTAAKRKENKGVFFSDTLELTSEPKFLTEFSELLLCIHCKYDSCNLTADFNIHVHNKANPKGSILFSLYGCIDFIHVTQPTHNLGHTLDPIILNVFSIFKCLICCWLDCLRSSLHIFNVLHLTLEAQKSCLLP